MAMHLCPVGQFRIPHWSVSLALLILIWCQAGNLHAQQPVVRAYSTNTADEDWSFLTDRSRKNDFWDPLKYISLGSEGRYLTLSSEIRYRGWRGLEFEALARLLRPGTTICSSAILSGLICTWAPASGCSRNSRVASSADS